MAKKNKLTWLDTEYIKNDLTLQPVLVNKTILYTLFDTHGYNYVFYSVRQVMDYLNDGKQEYAGTFESEDEMVEFLKNI